MKSKGLWFLLVLAGLILGCGQKGALVLPDAQHPHKKMTIPAPPKASRATSTIPATAPAASAAGSPTSPTTSATPAPAPAPVPPATPAGAPPPSAPPETPGDHSTPDDPQP